MNPEVGFGSQDDALLGGSQIMTMQRLVSKKAYSGKDLTPELAASGEMSMPKLREEKEFQDIVFGKKEVGEISEAQYELLSKGHSVNKQSLQSKQTKQRKKGSGSPKKGSIATGGFPVKGKGILKRSNNANADDYFAPECGLRQVEIAGVASAKLAYLMSQVLLYQEKEKILIFYETDQVAFFIAEALSIVGVKYLLCMSYTPS